MSFITDILHPIPLAVVSVNCAAVIFSFDNVHAVFIYNYMVYLAGFISVSEEQVVYNVFFARYSITDNLPNIKLSAIPLLLCAFFSSAPSYRNP